MKFLDAVKANAQYNRWANNVVLEAANALCHEKRVAPLMPGLDSICSVLNHVLVVDKLWVAELQDTDFEVTDTRTILHKDWDSFVLDRRDTDKRILDIIFALSEDQLEATLYCEEEIHSNLREWPFACEIDHIFRHQAHHRGQVVLMMEATSIGRLKIDRLFVPSGPVGRTEVV